MLKCEIIVIFTLVYRKLELVGLIQQKIKLPSRIAFLLIRFDYFHSCNSVMNLAKVVTNASMHKLYIVVLLLLHFI